MASWRAYTTSAAVRRLPSEKVTPSRRAKVQTSPVSSVWAEAHSTGDGVKLWSSS